MSPSFNVDGSQRARCPINVRRSFPAASLTRRPFCKHKRLYHLARHMDYFPRFPLQSNFGCFEFFPSFRRQMSNSFSYISVNAFFFVLQRASTIGFGDGYTSAGGQLPKKQFPTVWFESSCPFSHARLHLFRKSYVETELWKYAFKAINTFKKQASIDARDFLRSHSTCSVSSFPEK